MSLVSRLARPEILALKAYSHAAWEPSLQRMHANELPYRVAGDTSQAGLNRYPEPQPPPLVQGMAAFYGVDPAQLLVGRGSDEAIDLLLRVFCRAGQDNILVCPPTYSMYAVAAGIQGAGVVNVPLRPDSFELDVAAVLARVDASIKLVGSHRRGPPRRHSGCCAQSGVRRRREAKATVAHWLVPAEIG